MSNGINLGIQRFLDPNWMKGEVYAQDHILSVFSREADYERILKNVDGRPKVNTNVPVSFLPDVTLKDMQEKHIKHVFNSRFFKTYNKELDITIEGFKKSLHNSKLVVQFHVYNNEVFFVRHTFQYNENEDLRILQMFVEKYQQENLSKLFDCAIVDPNQIAIYIEQVFGLEISYVNLNAEFFRDIRQRSLKAERDRKRKADEDQNRIISIL